MKLSMKYSLVFLTMVVLTGCAGINGPCGPFAKNGELAVSKVTLNFGKCQVGYTFINKSNEQFKPAVATRVLDTQGNTLGQDKIYFDIIDPGRSQKKTGMIYDCGLGAVEVLGSDFFYPHGYHICGVQGHRYSW